MKLRILHNCGMNLARIRKARNLTQRDLAEMVGLDQSQIQRAEAMKPTAKLQTYIKCAEALDVTLGDIFADGGSIMDRELLNLFRRIPEARRQEALDLLKVVEGHAPPADKEEGRSAQA